MLAAGSALADCVKLLAEKKADLTKLDNDKRGCLQLAEQVQGNSQTLASWLKENVRNIPSTDGKGRAKADRSRGQFSQNYRLDTGPSHWSKVRRGTGGKGPSTGKKATSHNNLTFPNDTRERLEFGRLVKAISHS